MKTLSAICVFAVVGLICWLLQRRRMHPFWTRACTGRQWRAAFPDASKEEIREFLGVFCCAFGFRNLRRLCFRPDDGIMDVYRTIYPPRWALADALELETFAGDMNRRYGLGLLDRWSEHLTLGEVFGLTRTPGKCPGASSHQPKCRGTAKP